MIKVWAISTLCLASVLLSGTAFADPAGVTTEMDLRKLLQAASDDGWVTLSSTETESVQALSIEGVSINNRSRGSVSKPASKPADCEAFAQLNPDGLYAETVSAMGKSPDIATVFTNLLDGRPVSEGLLVPLENIADCGETFEIWSYLAGWEDMQSPQTAGKLIAALNHHGPLIREKAGVTLAIRAGLSGNRSMMRRIADTLEDSGLHGTPAWARDPAHILLEALLLQASNPMESQGRLEWLAERDGPEQMTAIELLKSTGDNQMAEASLERLGEDFSATNRWGARELQLNAAFETRDLTNIGDILDAMEAEGQPIEMRVASRLADLVSSNLDAESAVDQIAALNAYHRLKPRFSNLSADAAKDLAGQVDAVFSKVFMSENEADAEAAKNDAMSDAVFASPSKLRRFDSVGVETYLSQISKDVATAKTVLSDG